MYYWRQLNKGQREDALEYRRIQRYPKHSLPHFDFEAERQYLITAACYEHRHFIGRSIQRMTDFEVALLDVCAHFATCIYAWCILPNHFHILLKTAQVGDLRRELGKL